MTCWVTALQVLLCLEEMAAIVLLMILFSCIAGIPQVDGEGSSSNIGQCFNPAFVHSVAVPEMDTLAGLNKVCAVARGDGVVDVIEVESEHDPTSKTFTHHKKSQLRSKDSKKQATNGHLNGQSLGKRMQLDYALGGHTAAVSCV